MWTLAASYELYRQAVTSMNISFANLGNEECFECKKFDLHLKSSLHKRKDPNIDCEECGVWKHRKEIYVAARQEYEKDKKEREPEKIVVSADLQKVILFFVTYLTYLIYNPTFLLGDNATTGRNV